MERWLGEDECTGLVGGKDGIRRGRDECTRFTGVKEGIRRRGDELNDRKNEG